MSKSHIREMRKRRMIHRDAMREPSTTSTIPGFRRTNNRRGKRAMFRGIVCAHCGTAFAHPVCCQKTGNPVDRSMVPLIPQDELSQDAVNAASFEVGDD